MNSDDVYIIRNGEFIFLATTSFASAVARKDQHCHKQLLEAFDTAPDGELLASQALKEGYSLDANEKVCTVFTRQCSNCHITLTP
jgi:hypothetical protein